MGTEILNPCQLICLNQHKRQCQFIVSSEVGSKTVASLSYNRGRTLHFNHAAHISWVFSRQFERITTNVTANILQS